MPEAGNEQPSVVASRLRVYVVPGTWLAAVGTTIDEIVAIVTARFGTPPTGTPRGHVDDAVVQLRAAGVLE